MTQKTKHEIKQVALIFVGLALFYFVFSAGFASQHGFVRGLSWTVFIALLVGGAAVVTGLYGIIKSRFFTKLPLLLESEATSAVVYKEPLEPDTTSPNTIGTFDNAGGRELS
jgi:hypothetical protein